MPPARAGGASAPARSATSRHQGPSRPIGRAGRTGARVPRPARAAPPGRPGSHRASAELRANVMRPPRRRTGWVRLEAPRAAVARVCAVTPQRVAAASFPGRARDASGLGETGAPAEEGSTGGDANARQSRRPAKPAQSAPGSGLAFAAHVTTRVAIRLLESHAQLSFQSHRQDHAFLAAEDHDRAAERVHLDAAVLAGAHVHVDLRDQLRARLVVEIIGELVHDLLAGELSHGASLRLESAAASLLMRTSLRSRLRDEAVRAWGWNML